MENNLSEDIPSSVSIIDQISQIIGERDISPETLLEKCKDIKNWDTLIEHQKLLKQSLHRDVSIQSALLDFLLSTEQRLPESHQIELPTARKTAYTSIIDPITGLYNDRYFQIIVDAELKRAKRHSLPLTLMILDLDNFGTYAAIYGHETSDMALNETAIVLRKSCRKEDMLFRLRKNRFAVILLNIAREGAHKLGERLRENVKSHHFKGEDKLSGKRVTISGGIAIYPEDGKNSQTLIMASEEALATAKQSGRNRILEYSLKRRKMPRIEIALEAKYQIEGRKDIKPQIVYTKNISESGALITAANELSLGGIIVLTLKLPTGPVIKIKSESVRLSKKEGTREMNIAIKFIDMSPVDLLNLRNFIEQRLTNPR